MATAERRYDIDWIRVIAIGLLLIYHVAIGFQRWGIMIRFIANDEPWESLWIPMASLNIWRIPLLFFVSGMGVFFAMQKRTWKQLLSERAFRILLPYVFGTFVIVPISSYLWSYYYDLEAGYGYHPGHLWFLGNIFAYVVLLSPVFYYLKMHEQGKIATGIKRTLSHPLGLLLVMSAFVAEAYLIDPNPYELYAFTWHGFFLGFLAFFFGFSFVLSGPPFWQMILKLRWVLLTAALALFIVRLIQFQLRAPNYLLVMEADCWILSVLAFGYRYLNHPGKVLTYLSQAAYPVYIVHMIFLFLGSCLIFPLVMAPQIKFFLVLLFTIAGCFALYEFVIRRVGFIRPLFGLKGRDGRAEPILSPDQQ